MNAIAFDRLLWRTKKKAPQHPQTDYASSSYGRLRLRDTGGELPPLVFLCDPPVMIEAYDELIAQFSEQYRVLVIELPGFGFSRTANAKAYEFAAAVESIEIALQERLDRPAIICGPCICGFVATALAKRGTLPLAGLVLLQTPDLAGMLKWRHGMDPKGLLRTPYIGQMLVRAKAKSLTPFWYKYATAKSFDHQPLTLTTLKTFEAGAAYPLASMLQGWGHGPTDGDVGVPTVIIWGEQDRSHQHTDRECSRAHSSSAEIVRFEHCGHFTELEDPAGFAETVKPIFDQWQTN